MCIHSLSGLDLGLAYSGEDLGAGNGSADQILAGQHSFRQPYLAATYSTGDVKMIKQS
ncbi:hypothetical protein O9992_20430 [Vibrio lentus]|nr:hypothetical protein [Vibrio lentus]